MKKWMKNLKEINGQINYLFDQYNLLHLKTQIFLKNKDNLLQQIIELTKLFSEEITKQFQPHYNNLSEPPKNQEANPPLPNSTKNPSYELHDAETKLNHILKSLESQNRICYPYPFRSLPKCDHHAVLQVLCIQLNQVRCLSHY